MKLTRIIFSILSVTCLLTGCSQAANGSDNAIGRVNSYSQKWYKDSEQKQLVYSVDLTWLEVNDSFSGADNINSYLTALKDSTLAYAEEYASWAKEEDYSDFSSAASLCSSFCGFSYSDDHYISFLQKGYEYPTGAAHDMPFQTGHTFDLETGERLLLSDICADTEEELREIVTGYFAEMIEAEPENYWENAVDIVRETFTVESDFYLTPQGICFYYGPYVLAPYAAGFVEVEIPYEEFNLMISLE